MPSDCGWMPFSLLLHLVSSPSFFLSLQDCRKMPDVLSLLRRQSSTVSKSDRCACLLHLRPTFLQLRNSAKDNRNSILTQIDRGEQLCLLASPTDALASSNSGIDNRTAFAQRLRRAMCLLRSPTEVLASSNSAKRRHTIGHR